MIKTERLILKKMTDADAEAFYLINSDPEVMRFFPSPLTHEESDTMLKTIANDIEKLGWGLWGAFHQNTLVGMIGLKTISFESHFTPAVEVGWRLAKEHWGKGFATEGAKAALDYGFNELKLPEIVSITTTLNLPSQKVMQRLGMTHDPKENFDHPKLAKDHPLCRHVLYRKRRD